MNLNYWQKRQRRLHNAIANKSIKETEKTLRKYYEDAMKETIRDFEAVYDKILAAQTEGRQVTPADLYKLDRYWEMQNELKKAAQKLGSKQVDLLSKQFEKTWKQIYKSTSLPSDVAFKTISIPNAKKFIETVWCSDGLIFSQRVWNNVSKLVDTLNEELIHCVLTGKKTKELRDILTHRFGVSISQANTLIRTEMAQIQTNAAKQRYQDYGLDKYMFYADTDDKTCKHHSPSCKALDGKIFNYAEMQIGVNAPPMHPNCRCCIVPVIE